MLGSHLAVVIADDHAIETGDDFRYGSLMDWVWQIGITSGRAFEQHDEAVGEPVAEPFGAVVDAPCEVEDSGDLFRQGFDDVPDISDVIWGA